MGFANRWSLPLGAAVTVLGVALVGTRNPGVGGVALLLGWLALGLAIHRLGRRG